MAAGGRDRLVRLLFPPRRVAPLAHPPRRILVIRPDQLGDLLFATPALRRIRAAYPDAQITGLVGPWGEAIWKHQTALNTLGTLPFPGIVARPPRLWQPYTLLRAAAAELRDKGYDLAVVLRFDYWWGALLAEQARIPARWGYDLSALRPFLTHPIPYQAGRHEVEQDLALADAVAATALAPPPPDPPDRGTGYPPLVFPIDKADRQAGAALLPANGGRPAVVIHPGTNGSLKLWTLAGWAAVAGWLLDRGYHPIFTGSAAERRLVAAIRERLDPARRDQTASLAGQTTLGQLGALFAACGLVLGVDSGPLHIATAVGAATLRLYGPSDERIWGPWGDPAYNVAVRAPGTRPGHFLDPDRQGLEGGPEMQAILPEQVIGALTRLLGIGAGV